VPAAEGKKKIKNRGVQGWRPVLDREKKRFSFLGFPFFVLPLPNYKMTPPPLSFQPIFIGKILFRLQNWSLNFLFL
jgi:hypothetical protein